MYSIVTNSITDVYNTHRDGMTSLVSSVIFLIILQACNIVEIHYADALKPSSPINENLNSDQYVEMVARNVKALLDDSTFLLAPQRDG